jgi:hypothetical protein
MGSTTRQVSAAATALLSQGRLFIRLLLAFGFGCAGRRDARVDTMTQIAGLLGLSIGF